MIVALILALLALAVIWWLSYTVVIAFRVIVSLANAVWAIGNIAVSIASLIGELIVAAIPRRAATIAPASNVIPFRRQ